MNKVDEVARYEFQAPLELHGVGVVRVIWYSVLFLPSLLVNDLPFDAYPRLRIQGEIQDMPVAGAWIPVGDGRYYFIVSSQLRKALPAKMGDILKMQFRIDEQERVEVPDALMRRLLIDGNLMAKWKILTPGRRRGFCHHVASARTLPTINKRIDEVVFCVQQGLPSVKDSRPRAS